MAEDMSSVNVCKSFKTVTNEHESSALFLLQSIADEWRTNRVAYDSPGHLVRNFLFRAGVLYLGHEALQIHMALFRDVFVENKCVQPCAAGTGFDVRDYFELLRDEKLGWMSFLTMTLPYLRLQKANNFLEKLTQFISRIEDTSEESNADIRLLIFSLSLIQSIILDTVLAGNGDVDAKENAASVLSSFGSLKPHRQRTSDSQTMAMHLTVSVEYLLKLSSSNKFPGLILRDVNLLRELIECLIVNIAMLNPYSPVQDSLQLILNCYVGQVCVPGVHKMRQQGCGSNRGMNSWSKTWANESRLSNFVWTEIILKRAEGRAENVKHETGNKTTAEVAKMRGGEVEYEADDDVAVEGMKKRGGKFEYETYDKAAVEGAKKRAEKVEYETVDKGAKKRAEKVEYETVDKAAVEGAKKRAEKVEYETVDKAAVEGAKKRAEKVEYETVDKAAVEGAKKRAEKVEYETVDKAAVEGAKKRTEKVEYETVDKAAVEGAKKQGEKVEYETVDKAAVEGAKKQGEKVEYETVDKAAVEGAKKQGEKVEYETVDKAAVEGAKKQGEKVEYETVDKAAVEGAKKRAEKVEYETVDKAAVEGAKKQGEKVEYETVDKAAVEGAKKQGEKVEYETVDKAAVEGAKKQGEKVEYETVDKAAVEGAKKQGEKVEYETVDKAAVEGAKKQGEKVEYETVDKAAVEGAKKQGEKVEYETVDKAAVEGAKKQGEKVEYETVDKAAVEGAKKQGEKVEYETDEKTAVEGAKIVAEQETVDTTALEVDDACNFETKFSSFHNLMNGVLSRVQSNLFIDLVCWFYRGEVKDNDEFYKPLADILFEGKDIRVGHHVLSGHSLYSWFLEYVQTMPNEVVAVSLENQRVVVQRLLSETFKDFSRLKMSEIDFILKSRRELAGQGDLDLIKDAVTNKRNGWRDLLELGLNNTDINGWWRVGFFELVKDNEATLCTEKSVRQMVNILSKVAVHSHDNAEFCEKINQLSGAMFKRLPTLLQEQVVLSALVPSNHERPDFDLGPSGLQSLLSKREVIEHLTPLLNRLTSASVDKMVGHILLLCLFDADAVIQKVVQVALENKAQVMPIVEVLRRMPRICCYSDSKSSQRKLLICLHEILSGTVLSDNRVDNIIRMLCLFTETYNIEIDINSETHFTKNMPGLLSQSDIFQHFIRPSLDSETYSRTTTQQKQDNLDEHPAQQAMEGYGDILKDDMAKSDTEIHRSVVVGRNESDVAFQLPLDVALRMLSALLERLDLLEILAFKPFPLLAILADMYARNYIVFKDGNLDKRILLTKQASHKNIALLTAAIWKYFNIFTKADFLWLRHYALKCGWLYTAVLKPVLNIGCDVELHDILSSVASQLIDNQVYSTRGLVFVLQLALVNDEMFGDVTAVIKQSYLSAGQRQLVLAVGSILTSSLTTEMFRLVSVMMMLLANQDNPFLADNSLLVPEMASDVHLRIQASQLLMDAVLQLSVSEFDEKALGHIVSNYQAAVQSLVHQENPQFCLLVDVFCHCCTVLSSAEAQAAHLLQVSAMDILTKLKAWMLATSKERSDMFRTEVQRPEYEKGVGLIENYIACVSEDNVRQTLLSQLVNVR